MLSSPFMPFWNIHLLPAGFFTCGNSGRNPGKGLGWLLLETTIRTASNDGQRKISAPRGDTSDSQYLSQLLQAQKRGAAESAEAA